MRTRRQLPSVEELTEWFIEEPTGVLRWRKDYQDRKRLVGKAGEEAGKINSNGHVQVGFKGSTHHRARLIYKLHKGKDPHGVIEHINGDTLDDRFENLRHETTSINTRRTRDRDGDYFVVTEWTGGADGRTVKTVTLSWRCEPGEDAEEIAAELNARCEEYLRALNREQQAKRREALREVMDRATEPKNEEEQEQQVA